MVALGQTPHPSGGSDLISSGHVKKLRVEGDTVRMDFHLRPNDPPELVKRARAAVAGVKGVGSVKIDVQLPQMSAQPPAGARPRGPQTPTGRPRGQTKTGGPRGGRGLQPGSVPAPTPNPNLLPDVDRIVAVSSGKGGVGKSMVAANLAAALALGGDGPRDAASRAAEGAGDRSRVGLLDADIYGPNIPRMFGVHARPKVTGEKGSEMIEPLSAHGVRLMSLGFLLERDQPAIMRGPLISGVLKQFLEQVRWGPLDYMVVDMPPGTGDAQLSLVQSVEVDGVVMVTTPQEVATGDVRRGVKMFERVNAKVLGIVENMSPMTCPHCGRTTDVFGEGGGERLADELKIPFLGRVPLDPAVAVAGDAGSPSVVATPNSPAAAGLAKIADAVRAQIT